MMVTVLGSSAVMMARASGVSALRSNAEPRMTLWAALIAALTLLGFATFMAGLVITLPLIGHATWHAYRDVLPSTQA